MARGAVSSKVIRQLLCGTSKFGVAFGGGEERHLDPWPLTCPGVACTRHKALEGSSMLKVDPRFPFPRFSYRNVAPFMLSVLLSRRVRN